MTTRVWALMLGGADPAGLRGQTRPPERALTPEEVRSGRFDQPPDWLWVLDARVRPAPDCLDALLKAADSLGGLPAPALIASRVQSPEPLDEPIPRIDKELEIASAEHGLVALRAVPTASFLIRPGAVSGALTSGELFAFTAALLREVPGYIEPGSLVALEGRPSEGLFARFRTLASGAWRGPELVWLALRLLRQAAARRGSP
jgi:hypothetical protein